MATAILKRFTKVQVATAIAVIFHLVGLVGILVFQSDLIIRSTPLNLLLSFGLLLWTQHDKNLFFWAFFIVAVLTGFIVEVIGVNTGRLFGDYQYGAVLGTKWLQVPLIIGINWFITIFCCTVTINTVLLKISKPLAESPMPPAPIIKSIAVIVDAATLAVFFDWLMEPVAVRLGFWSWADDGSIPLYNYVCWFIISLLLVTVMMACKFSKQNKFAINLLLIQAFFFLILRTFLK